MLQIEKVHRTSSRRKAANEAMLTLLLNGKNAIEI
jgi:hypothetical protein